MIQMSGRAADRPSVTFRASFCCTQYHTGNRQSNTSYNRGMCCEVTLSQQSCWGKSSANKHGFMCYTHDDIASTPYLRIML